MKQGIFITFEGPDGSGKSTQIHKLAELLKQSGHEIIMTREPGGTAISEQIRNVILNPENKAMDPVAEMMLYAASRAQLVSEVIRPALESGKTVICDRYVDSSVAYQGYGRSLGDSVRIVNAYATQGLMPNLTILLLLDPEEGKKRIEKRIASGEETEKDRMELESIAFHTRVYEGYKALAAEEPERVLLLDASDTIENLAKAIQSRITELL